MKRILAGLLCLALSACAVISPKPHVLADVRISQLPTAGSITGSDVFPDVHVGVTSSVSAATLGNYVNSLLSSANLISWLPTLVSTDCLSNNGTTLNWATCGSGGAGSFSAITAGTATVSLAIGTGGDLHTSGTGTIEASTAAALAATGTSCAGGQVPTGVDVHGNATGCFTPSGTGTVTTSGTPVATNPSCFSAAAIITNCTFSGDVSFSGPATTVVKIEGGAIPASAVVVGTNSSSQPVAATTTGSGAVALATSPSFTTPNLGTPSAVNLANALNLAVAALPAFSGDCNSIAGTASLSCTGGRTQYTHVSTATFLSSGNTSVIVDSGTGPITLPSAVGDQHTYCVSVGPSNTSTVSIPTTSSQTIQGAAAPATISGVGNGVCFNSDNVNWTY